MIRPANLAATSPGRGWTVGSASDGTRVAVINLLGDLFMAPAVTPFEIVDELVEETKRETPVILVDFHGEATSEKVALARYLDGQVTAVFGTHTHVQTNDARVQPGGTAALSDAGMTGPHDSVIGVKAELAIQRMRTGIPVRFETAEGRCAPRGRAARVRRLRPRYQLRDLPRLARLGHALGTRRARRARGRGRARARTRARRSGAPGPSSGTGTRAA